MERVERTVSETGDEGQASQESLRWLREAQRGRMVRTLEYLLRIARREIRKPSLEVAVRQKWVNTICYITQTLNSVLRDTDYDQLKQQVLNMQEKIEKMMIGKYQQPQKTTRPGQ